MGGACGSRDASASNDRHRNTKLVRTGFVLIFQRKVQKHLFALYIRHFTQLLVGCCVSSLRRKTPSVRFYFVSFLYISYQQHGQNNDCPHRAKKTFFTAAGEITKGCGAEEKSCCKKGSQTKEGQAG